MSASCPRSTIAAHVSNERKTAFAALAASRGISESALLGLMVETVVESNEPDRETGAGSSTGSARITVRLRSGDRALLRSRALQRGMTLSGYLAALVRAHVRKEAPVPQRELEVLKVAVNRLAAFERRWSALRKEQVGDLTAMNETAVEVAELRRSVAEYVRANLLSWETEHA